MNTFERTANNRLVAKPLIRQEERITYEPVVDGIVLKLTLEQAEAVRDLVGLGRVHIDVLRDNFKGEASILGEQWHDDDFARKFHAAQKLFYPLEDAITEAKRALETNA